VAVAGEPVEAAGGVVTRRSPAGTVEVLLVHRPRYDDWSLPKGKLQPGERHVDAAIREVAEETGWEVAVGNELRAVQYRDRHGRPKHVRYWHMTPLHSAPFAPNEEVDEVRWLSLDQAATLLSYDLDRRLLEQLGAGELH
jgi:8-oxo-dGTP pyrophosphatase MutT (NUDIX family)